MGGKAIAKVIGWYFVIIAILQIVEFLRSLSSENGQFPILAVFYIITGIGLLFLKGWARISGIVLGILHVLLSGIFSIVAVFSGKQQTPALLLFGLFYTGVGIAIIYYLTLSKVKEQFK